MSANISPRTPEAPARQHGFPEGKPRPPETPSTNPRPTEAPAGGGGPPNAAPGPREMSAAERLQWLVGRARGGDASALPELQVAFPG